MATDHRVRRKQVDDSTIPLFPDLPMPPHAEDILELRGLRRPVWTEQKARLISRYLKLFTFVTKHGTYIDGFAGQQNVEAEGGWAAELVLDNRPRWLRHFYLCDNDVNQIDALNTLKERQPPIIKGLLQSEWVILGHFRLLGACK